MNTLGNRNSINIKLVRKNQFSIVPVIRLQARERFHVRYIKVKK